MLALVTWAARSMAILGGIVLTLVVISTTLSVLGLGIDEFSQSDWLEGTLPGFATWLGDVGFGPVPGEHELTQAFVGFTIFAFLPICQLNRGHATVDIFAPVMSDRVNRFLSAFWEVALTLIIVLIAWRLSVAFAEKFQNGQTTFFLQFPLWWSYGASLFAATVAALVALYCAYGRVTEAVTGRAILPSGDSAP